MSAAQLPFAGLPRLVMFDLDGTLVDSVPDLAAAVDKMLLALGRSRPAWTPCVTGSATARACWCAAPGGRHRA